VLQARATASLGGGCGFFDGPASRPSQSSDGADAQQSIRSLSLWRRAIILAGPLSNVALASALFLSSISGAGINPLRISRNPISVFRCS
jgi:membrane-associated protease RseP (regulator of RpoE activity)